jgi:hypothetical protein
MASVVVYGDKYEVSSKNGRWSICDLENGFLILISDVIDPDYIVNIFEQSDFESWQYNDIFKSIPNNSWCLRMMVDKSKEEILQSTLENFNI